MARVPVNQKTLESKLKPQHLAELRASGISDDIIRKRGYRSITTNRELEATGFGKYQSRAPGILIPLRHVPNITVDSSKPPATAQFKPNKPRYIDGVKAVKYETPAGSRVCLDIPPGVEKVLRDSSIPLLITEGIKKADSAVSHGIDCIALLGVNSWDVEDWRSINLSHRRIYVCFDSDLVEKREVALALKRLKSFLRSRGASVVSLYLPAEPGEKVGLDDYLAKGHSKEELFALTKRTKIDGEINHDLPTIEAQKHDLATMVDQAIQALVSENDPPIIFNHMDRLVRVRHVELRGNSIPILEPMDKDMLIDRLSMVANWMTTNQSGRRPVNPPDIVARMIKTRTPIQGLPTIRRVTSGPIFTETGLFCSSPGYDADAQVYVNLDAPIKLKSQISMRDVQEAVDEIQYLIDEFPFEDRASRANAFAFLLLPFARDLINGPTPIHLFDAPKAGTGKTKLMSLLASIFSLGAGFLENAPENEEEWRKRLTSSFVEGGTHVLLDDVKGINSNALQSAVTNPLRLWKDRVLGKSEIVRAEINVVWGIAGNNLSGRGEILRRCIRIRLNAKMERPQSREGWRIPIPEEYVERNRTKLMTACATIIQFWIDNGLERGSPKTKLGSFEAWTGVMSGILDSAGIAGFLENQAEMMEQADEESDAFVAFFSDWNQEFGSKWVTAKQVLRVARRHFEEYEAGLAENAAKVKLGKFLRKHRDTIHGGLLLSMKPNKDGNQFRLTSVDK